MTATVVMTSASLFKKKKFAALFILLVNEIVLKTVSDNFLESNLLEDSVCHFKLDSLSMAAVLQRSFAVPLGSSENSVVS